MVLQAQNGRLLEFLKERGMARATELTRAGFTATSIARMKEKGLIHQLSRGLYQSADLELQANHDLAVASMLAPKGIICLVSALDFHELTVTMPTRVWVAIGSRERKPVVATPALQFVRFNEIVLHSGIETHHIAGVSVKIYNPAKTVVDMFRYRQSEGIRYSKSPGLNLALEGMKEALHQGKATPADIARYASEAGIWKVIKPYLEAMSAHG